MSDQIKPMTLVVLAVMPDGTTRMKVEGRSSVADVMLCAKHLELEAAHAFGRMKLAQAVDAGPRIVQAPADLDVKKAG